MILLSAVSANEVSPVINYSSLAANLGESVNNALTRDASIAVYTETSDANL